MLMYVPGLWPSRRGPGVFLGRPPSMIIHKDDSLFSPIELLVEWPTMLWTTNDNDGDVQGTV